jgi:hypothetical protein
VSQNCNLVSEFNGLVSKRVNQQDWPFLLLYISSFIHPFFIFISSIDLINLFQGLFFENYFLLKQDADVYENLTLFL